MNLPKFLFVGTAKAGTTSIYHYLRRHPEVEIPMKETFYFMRDVLKDNHLPYPKQRPQENLILEEEDYTALYRDTGPEKLTGEIGTGYLYYHDESIPRIIETLGSDIKIAIILRNPIDRCYSSYMHFVKDLFEEGSFEDALQAEAERTAANWDFMWRHQAIGMYAEQVSAFQSAFTNVKVWLYDDLKNNPEATMDSIANYIGVSPFKDGALSRSFNPSGTVKNRRLQKFITHESPIKAILRPVFRAAFSQEKRERIRKGIKSKNLKKAEGMTSATRAALVDAYEPDIRKLEHLIDRELSSWIHSPV